MGFSIAAENPATTVLPYKGGPRISSDDNVFPDIIGRYTWKGDWGNVTAAGLFRQLKYETTGTNAINDSTSTAAGSLSGKFMVFGKDDIRWMILGGNLGRYVGLNFTNDAVLDANGNLESIDGWAGYVAYRHLWTDRLRSSLFYAMRGLRQRHQPDRPECKPGERELDVNLFYSPIPKLDIGAEYRWAKRELESGDDGTLRRFQLTSKYSF